MADSARSSDPAVQAQLDRLEMLSPGRDVLGLSRIAALLGRLGNPHLALPPVFHVAGTNGKGSTVAFLRAMLEADGKRVHAYTSPHLVRFNERIRVAGSLITDAALAPLLAEVLDCSEDIAPSFFEATTAAAFLAFARTPADACIVEVGLGGRLDATNVLAAPAAGGIAALGIDHKEFLLVAEDATPADPHARIAWEKAGIAKPGAPLVTQAYRPVMTDAIAAVAARIRAPLFARGKAWDATIADDAIAYRDAAGDLTLPLPRMAGAHQADNAALAVAMLRHQDAISVSAEAMRAGIAAADWPGRLQPLSPGPLRDLLPAGTGIWLDGGHNPNAARALAAFLDARQGDATLVLGLLANKDLGGVLDSLASHASGVIAVPVPDHDHHAPQAIADAARARGLTATVAEDVAAALAQAAPDSPPTVLIAGSLYLAGSVLAANRQLPD
ncbi:bifunctional folylpolyglutamate synthase/dihydrofolate synthase [Sphingorhabdus soli]|uniref:Dihydrofolate synthase/folylpolyglutamate synthase n=1 Tax=Flavisphingopyxis soli TaxID=2601267 RepID=A0A5C6UQ27_9SPHN|nr:bifunctional folylpolyglutamate synthase/dihydrofolate synthase [Sphingorhabdus soli]TXC74291.1 bifunctional folylpolyglutamate synthase/dihydrofolate synthase [Sphingorhabdus soli]